MITKTDKDETDFITKNNFWNRPRHKNLTYYNTTTYQIAHHCNLHKLKPAGRRRTTYGVQDYNNRRHVRNKDWNSLTRNQNERRLKQLIENTKYTPYYPEEPTLCSDDGTIQTITDLGIANNVVVTKINTQEYLESDHKQITLKLKVKAPRKAKYKQIIDLDNANWKEYKIKRKLDNDITLLKRSTNRNNYWNSHRNHTGSIGLTHSKRWT